jgi:sigma-B regulation protein RsbU (phosphoserine phosphatase)
MASSVDTRIRQQLLARRDRLRDFAKTGGEDDHLVRLLGEVDSALERMDGGTYGLCEVCHEEIEADRLIADPLARFCLDHLTNDQQRALEADLELASRIQGALLPQKDLRVPGWDFCYHYEAAGPTSGDYCDLVAAGDGSVYFIVGDVKGKGLAASILMSHLNATFRALISLGLPLDQLVERASRAFCESTLPTYFATLVCIRADAAGNLEVCNAGHLPPLQVHEGTVTSLPATGLPLGMFCNERFSVDRLFLPPGDTLFLYTDGLCEAVEPSGEEYGLERLSRFLAKRHALAPAELVPACIGDLRAFRSGEPIKDDLTLMALRRLRPAGV